MNNYQRLKKELKDFSKFQQDWDGECAAKPIFSAIEDTLNFINLIKINEYVETSLHSDGSIILEFYDELGNMLNMIRFLGNGNIAFNHFKTTTNG